MALQFADEGPIAKPVGVEVVVPQKQVVNGAHQTTATDNFKIGGPVHQKTSVLSGVVSRHAPRDNHLIVVVKPRARHSEWFKDLLGGKLGQRLSRRTLYSESEKKVIGVAIYE